MLNTFEFLNVKAKTVDVRSPGEFANGHILGAINIPLLDDSERKSVGTLYKEKGMKEAFFLGLKFVGPKLAGMVEQFYDKAENGLIKIYCFRGGLRSSSIADLIQKSGIKAYTLKGGYKAYRRFCLDQLKIPLTLNVIGGATGSGKTDLLQSIQKLGGQVLDLESLASHRGSVFGHIHQEDQSSQEHFENNIAEAFRIFTPDKPVWVEDESRMIGKLKIPDPLFDRMQKAPLFVLERGIEARIHYLLELYGEIPIDEFTDSLTRIKKRLGSTRFQEIIGLARLGKWSEAVHILINYYDKAYKNSLNNKTIIPLKGYPCFDTLANALLKENP